ncbi:MAG: NAD-dependent protein deacylase [Thermonema sp.]|uniref:SIR2 family NAD-dependent protein deacylase n=2 Tax=Thermonema TaxID=28194 RepID=UPI0021DEE214|nr:MAG: NAD-dependent protein deacylase [Thermonema sp.]
MWNLLSNLWRMPSGNGNRMKKVVVLTGAGISAESGLKTFRDAGGLWEGYDITEVASIEGWHRNPQKVLEFYNMRRRQLAQAQPNAAHRALKELERCYEVVIITQNVDDLHERAGSSRIIHLHGELTKARSSRNPQLIYDIGYRDIQWGDTAEDGSQLRPHIVWFGEPVPMMDAAIAEVEQADLFIIIGTSLVVYPAAGLIDYASPHIPKYLVDIKRPDISWRRYPHLHMIEAKASEGVPRLVKELCPQADV